jgi:hypothetical protein
VLRLLVTAVLMSSISNRRLDAAFRSRDVVLALWNMALDVKVMRTCTYMLRKCIKLI